MREDACYAACYAAARRRADLGPGIELEGAKEAAELGEAASEEELRNVEAEAAVGQVLVVPAWGLRAARVKAVLVVVASPLHEEHVPKDAREQPHPRPSPSKCSQYRVNKLSICKRFTSVIIDNNSGVFGW